jgi:hypothetical protein
MQETKNDDERCHVITKVAPELNRPRCSKYLYLYSIGNQFNLETPTDYALRKHWTVGKLVYFSKIAGRFIVLY